MTNCVNFGAPLHGWKCEYCGTEYRDLKNERDRENGICVDCYRDSDGILHRNEE